MKLKTIKSAKKRIISVSANGKLLRRKMSAQHLMAGKNKRTKQAAGKTLVASSADTKKIKKLIPYS